MSGAFPVVDIGAFTRDGASAAEKAAVVDRIGAACETAQISPASCSTQPGRGKYCSNSE